MRTILNGWHRWLAVSPIRIATGELQRKAAPAIQLDLTDSGVLLETKKTAVLAEAHCMSVAPHICEGRLKIVIGFTCVRRFLTA